MRQTIAAGLFLLMLLFLPPWLRAEEPRPTGGHLAPAHPNPAAAPEDGHRLRRRPHPAAVGRQRRADPDGGGVSARRGAG